MSSVLSFHAFILFWEGSFSKALETRRKLFLDFRREIVVVCPYIGCLGSLACFCRSKLVEISRLIDGGAMPAYKYTFSIGVILRHPVTIRHASFRAVSFFFAWVDLPHNSHAYWTTEKQRDVADTRRVWGCAPHFDPTVSGVDRCVYLSFYLSFRSDICTLKFCQE